MDKTSVIILNWNGARILRKYLPSVVAHTPEAEIIVADNGSTDDSLQVLAKEFPTVRTIVLDKNYGFAEGYNRAIDLIDSEYVVLLNSDVAVTDNWLDSLLDYLEQHPDVAAVQPKIRSDRQRAFFEHAGAAGGFLGHPVPVCVFAHKSIKRAADWMLLSLPIWKRLTSAGEYAIKVGVSLVCRTVRSIISAEVRSVMIIPARHISIIATTC